MLREVTTIFTDWLMDPANGIVPALEQVPRLDGDPEPLRDGATLHVLSEFTDVLWARGQYPDKLPALTIRTLGPAGIQGESGRGQQGDLLRVDISHFDRNDDILRAVKAGALVLRAARRSLNRLAAGAGTNHETRTRGQVRLLEITRIQEARFPDERPGQATLTGGLLVTCRALDLNP